VGFICGVTAAHDSGDDAKAKPGLKVFNAAPLLSSGTNAVTTIQADAVATASA
jgi:hypothetical protein